MNDYDVRTVESMAQGARRDALLGAGYRYRVIRWNDAGTQCESIAFYKTASGAKKMAAKADSNSATLGEEGS
jgi:hypothetical protein